MSAQSNSNWQDEVRVMLRDGYGCEDIAVRLTARGRATTADQVRDEVQILRNEGRIMQLFWGGK